MFLDKLWLRIRGELLTLKEDFTSSEDLRDKAADLLNRLEHRVSGKDLGPETDARGEASREASRRSQESTDVEAQSLEDLKREWEDLKNRTTGSAQEAEESEPPPPNPRQLG